MPDETTDDMLMEVPKRLRVVVVAELSDRARLLGAEAEEQLAIVDLWAPDEDSQGLVEWSAGHESAIQTAMFALDSANQILAAGLAEIHKQRREGLALPGLEAGEGT